MSGIRGALVEEATTRLSLAVYLTDEYSAKGVVGNPQVSLKGHDLEPVRNPSGYYLFLELPEGSYAIQVKGGEHYLDEEEDVRPGDLERRSPVVNIALKPTPSYPFPHSATLVRGRVKDSQGRGISRVAVKVKGRDIQTRTTEKGEFVVYFREKEDFAVVDGERLVWIDEGNPRLEVEHPDHGRITKAVRAGEGETTSLSITYP